MDTGNKTEHLLSRIDLAIGTPLDEYPFRPNSIYWKVHYLHENSIAVKSALNSIQIALWLIVAILIFK